jgi:hypothetical protein
MNPNGTQLNDSFKSSLGGVSKRFAIATETTDGIIKGKKYQLIESESMGYYIIDESGEETYYHHSSLNAL